MEIIDLSHPITPQTPAFPGTRPPVFKQACNIATDGFAEKEIAFCSHTATHVDAPSHIFETGKGLDAFDAEKFIGTAELIDATGLKKSVIEIADLRPRERRLIEANFIIFKTGWSSRWGDESYFHDFPVLSPEAASWLSHLPLKGIGVDAISVDRVDDHSLPVHRILLEKEIVIVENLTNLAQLRGPRFLFCCLPLKFTGADGSPVRAVGIC